MSLNNQVATNKVINLLVSDNFIIPSNTYNSIIYTGDNSSTISLPNAQTQAGQNILIQNSSTNNITINTQNANKIISNTGTEINSTTLTSGTSLSAISVNGKWYLTADISSSGGGYWQPSPYGIYTNNSIGIGANADSATQFYITNAANLPYCVYIESLDPTTKALSVDGSCEFYGQNNKINYINQTGEYLQINGNLTLPDANPTNGNDGDNKIMILKKNQFANNCRVCYTDLVFLQTYGKNEVNDPSNPPNPYIPKNITFQNIGGIAINMSESSTGSGYDTFTYTGENTVNLEFNLTVNVYNGTSFSQFYSITLLKNGSIIDNSSYVLSANGFEMPTFTYNYVINANTNDYFSIQLYCGIGINIQTRTINSILCNNRSLIIKSIP